jgi:hypothetical protein
MAGRLTRRSLRTTGDGLSGNLNLYRRIGNNVKANDSQMGTQSFVRTAEIQTDARE